MALPVIIFDWDNTLLCSTYLEELKCYVTDPSSITAYPNLEDWLTLLADMVEQLLTLAMTLGKVYIVTNAETGWVELSAKVFYKDSISVLSKIPIISARSIYGTAYPNEPSWMWKHHAMLSTVSADTKHLMSIGDSTDEHTAALKLDQDGVVSVKVIKLMDKPSLLMVFVQLHKLISNLQGYIKGDAQDIEFVCYNKQINPT